MEQDEITKLKIDDIVNNARKNLPPEYAKRPWAHPELKRGTALLQSDEGLNSYMAAYGDAHKQKAFQAFKSLPLHEIKGSFEICDWGCGQGIATMCLLEELEAKKVLPNLKTIHLIEPGTVALKRAESNIRNYDSELKIECINKGLPSANAAFECVHEITFEQPTIIHLFSNILDIESINLKMVANLVASSGNRHYVVCIGPASRNEDRINAFCRYFDTKYVNFLQSFRESQFYRDNFYTGHVFGCFIKIFRFDSRNPVLIPYEFYAPKQFFAAYQSDINQISLDKLDCAFDVLAPFDLGGSVYDDPIPPLAVLNNIIVRGLPTKLSPWIESLLSKEFEASQETEYLGTIRFETVKNLNEEEKNLIKLIPIGVARIQKVIIEALLTGKIALHTNWRILVNEKDVPCTAMAIKELSVMYNHLVNASLNYECFEFPEIELTVINSKYPSSSLHLDAKVFSKSDISITEEEYDLVIDISNTEISQPQSVQFSEFRAKNNCYFNIRNSSEIYDERYIYTTERITYKPLTNILPQGTHEIIDENAEHLRYFLQLIFRKQDFRPGQLPIISRALQLKSVIGLLPTGAGKSLTYQIAAFLQPGITIVIDPLISLMKDQYDGLLKCGIDIATYINSSVSNKSQRESEMKESKYLFVFLSPERLTIDDFRRTLKAMRDTKVYFAYGVIDEVHCVSEWGHDFRFSYLHLGRNLYSYVLPAQNDTGIEELNHISLIGLTATASFDVLADVERELSGNSAFPLDAQSTVRYENTNRLELQYRIIKIPEPKSKSSMWDIYGAKNETVPRILKDIFYGSMCDLSRPASIQRIKDRFIERENIDSESDYAREISHADIAVNVKKDWYEGGDASAIVFCPHRSGSLGVNDSRNPGIATSIGSTLGIDTVSKFCGGDSLVSQDEFISGKSNLMVATKAFGMGIDKPNVRFTLNVNHSGSLEAYVQEAGRAGRDRKMALSVIMYSDCNVLDKSTGEYQPVDYGVHKFFYDGNFIGPEFEKIIMYYLMAFQPITIIDEKNEQSTFSKGFIPPVKAANPGERITSLISYNYPSESSEELDLMLQKAGWPPSGGISDKIEQRREKYFECLMKAIYRMCCIGLIEDFTVDYRNKKFMITSVSLEEGGYYSNLKAFLLRYFSENRANQEVEKAKSYRGQDEIQKCLGYLIDFVYKSIAVKRKKAISDIELFCKSAVESSANWLEVNEDLKDYLYFYFNSKYARPGFQAPNDEAFSLVDDTVEGKEFNPDHIYKYMRVIDDEIIGTGTPNDNVKHLLGAVRLVRRALTDTNPTLDFLNVFCIFYLKPDRESNSLNEELKNSYLNGYIDFRKRSDDLLSFYSHIGKFKNSLKNQNIVSEEQFSDLNDLEIMAEGAFHTEWLSTFAKKFSE